MTWDTCWAWLTAAVPESWLALVVGLLTGLAAYALLYAIWDERPPPPGRM